MKTSRPGCEESCCGAGDPGREEQASGDCGACRASSAALTAEAVVSPLAAPAPRRRLVGDCSCGSCARPLRGSARSSGLRLVSPARLIRSGPVSPALRCRARSLRWVTRGRAVAVVLVLASRCQASTASLRAVAPNATCLLRRPAILRGTRAVARGADRGLCRLDQQPARVRLTGPGDVSGRRRLLARLAHAGVQADVADQLAGAREAGHVADHRGDASAVIAPTPGIVIRRRTSRASERLLGEWASTRPDLDRARHASADCSRPARVRLRGELEPASPPAPAEHVGHRRLDQVARQHRVDLVAQPRR